MRGCGRNVADVLTGIVTQASVYVCFSHVSVWPRGHCLPGKSGPSSRTACEEQLISSDQSCPHSQPPPLPERKINCTHAVNKNKKIYCDGVSHSHYKHYIETYPVGFLYVRSRQELIGMVRHLPVSEGGSTCFSWWTAEEVLALTHKAKQTFISFALHRQCHGCI